MRRVALLTAALLLAPAAPSYAAGEPVPGTGGCAAVWGPAPDDPWNRVAGLVYGYVAVGDFVDTVGYPASVTLTCSVQSGRYDPSDPDDHTATGSGVNAAVVLPETFTAAAPGASETVGLCSRVDVTDAAGTRTFWRNHRNAMWVSTPMCYDGVYCLSDGPECVWLWAMLQWLSAKVPSLFQRLDSAVCPVLAVLAPGIPSAVDVEPDGDLYVDDVWVWDCPPYGS